MNRRRNMKLMLMVLLLLISSRVGAALLSTPTPVATDCRGLDLLYIDTTMSSMPDTSSCRESMGRRRLLRLISWYNIVPSYGPTVDRRGRYEECKKYDIVYDIVVCGIGIVYLAVRVRAAAAVEGDT